MSLAMLIPLLLGTVGILQGALNKQLSQTIGVAQATMMGSAVTLLLSVGLYTMVRVYPQYFPDFFHARMPLSTWKWWYVIPGIFGLVIVAGLPYAFAKVGAVKVTIGLIAAQMITSVFWDLVIDHLPMTWTKWLGLVLAFISVILVTAIRV